MKLLNAQQIEQKINRLAMEIMERNTNENELYIIGVNARGLELGRRLQAKLLQMAEAPIHLWNIQLNPIDPMEKEAQLDHDVAALKGKAVLLVDDVANTGRTLYYALRPLFSVLPSKVEVAVMVDRQHKAFPVQTTYVGLELSTTIGDNVQVNLSGTEEYAVLSKSK